MSALLVTGSPTNTRRKDEALQIRARQLAARRKRKLTLLSLAQILSTAVFVVPIIWMYMAALRPNTDIRTGSWVPAEITLENFVRLFDLGIVPQAMFNSTIVAAISALVVSTVATLASYALSRFRFRGRSLSSGFLLAGQLVPGLVVLVPLVVAFRQFGLSDTLVALTIAHLTLGIPIAVLLLRNYLDDIPVALEEAAIVDGCTRFGALMRIILPILRPAIAAVTAFSFILSWGEYIIALSLITSQDKKTLPLAMQSLFQLHGVDIGVVMAFGVTISLPVAILFMLIQKSFVSNLGLGGVKG